MIRSSAKRKSGWLHTHAEVGLAAADGVLVYRAECLVDICYVHFFLCGHDRGRINLGIFSIVLKIELYNKGQGSLVYQVGINLN